MMGRNYAELTNANQKHCFDDMLKHTHTHTHTHTHKHTHTHRRLCVRIRCVHLIRGYTVKTDIKIAFDLTFLC